MDIAIMVRTGMRRGGVFDGNSVEVFASRTAAETVMRAEAYAAIDEGSAVETAERFSDDGITRLMSVRFIESSSMFQWEIF